MWMHISSNTQIWLITSDTAVSSKNDYISKEYNAFWKAKVHLDDFFSYRLTAYSS